MGVLVLNNVADPFNTLDYWITDLYLGRGVTIRKLEGSILIPARTAGQFYFLYGCANQDGSSPAVVAALSSAARPARDAVKMFGAIGTRGPADSDLIIQRQDDREVLYSGSHTFDLAIGEPGGFTTNTWAERESFGGWPPGVVAATLWRMESLRINNADAAGLQLAQSNIVGVAGTDGGVGGPDTRGHITQSKGLVRLNQGGEQSEPRLKVAMDPSNDKIWVRAAVDCKGFLMLDGYELRGDLA